MPKHTKAPTKRARAKQNNIRLHDGDKAFIKLAAVAKDFTSLSAYIVQAAIRQAERDLNEPHSMLRRADYQDRLAAMLRLHPDHPIFG